MTVIIKDRVKQTATAIVATGDLSLVGTPSGYVSFASVLNSGEQVYYCVENGSAFEVGIGTYGASGANTFRRDTVLNSSTGSRLSVSGRATLFITVPASKFPFVTESGELSLALNTLNDVTLTAPASGESLKYNGSAWINEVVSGYTTEEAQDAIGGILVDTSSISFSYNDGTPSISASVRNSGVTNDMLATGIDVAKLGSGSVSSIELGYLDGVTSSLQEQLDSKYSNANPSGYISASLASDTYVPYSGATGGVNLGTYALTCGAITASSLLSLQNSTTPMEFNLHNTHTSATSREYLKMLAVTGGAYQIGSAIGSAGGTNRAITFGHWNAGGTFSGTASITTGGRFSDNGGTPDDTSAIFGAGTSVFLSSGSKDRQTVFGGAAQSLGPWSVVVGGQAITELGGVAIGASAYATNQSVAIGMAAGANGTSGGVPSSYGVNGYIILRANSGSAAPTAQYQFIVSDVRDGYFGNGITNSSPQGFKLNATGGSGTNIAGANFTLAGGRGTGSAVGGSLIFQTAPAGSSGSSPNALVDRLTIGSTGTFIFGGGLTIGPFTGYGASTDYIQASSSWSVEPHLLGYPWHFGFDTSTTRVTIQTANSTTGVRVGSDGAFMFSSTTNSRTGTIDLFLMRDGAGVLSQRNSTNAQTLQVYNTYASSTSGEMGELRWASNVLYIGSNKGSAGGSARDVAITHGGTVVANFLSDRFYLGPIADSTATGGNARGQYATDLQMFRGAANQVVSGNASFGAGQSNRISGTYCGGIGSDNVVTGNNSFAVGNTNSVTHDNSSAFGVYAATRMTGMRVVAQDSYDQQGAAQLIEVTNRHRTTSATPANWDLPLTSGNTYHFNLLVAGVKSDGSQMACYTRRISAKNVAGTVTIVNNQAVCSDYEDNPSTDLTVSASGSNVRVSVTGIAGETWRWQFALHGVEIKYGT